MDKNNKINVAGGTLEQAANLIIKGLGSTVFAILLFFGMRWTFYNELGDNEKMLIQKDSVVGNLFWVVLLFGIVFCISQIIKKYQDKAIVVNRIIFVVALLWIAGCCFWWISSGDRPPRADGREICKGIEGFLQGDYKYFQPGGYFHMYPNQLGLAIVIEGIYRLFGVGEYIVFQIICGCMAVGVFVIGYAITGMLADALAKDSTQILYSILMCGCLPLFFYTTWVYGEIPFLFFSFLAFWFLFQYEKKLNWGYLAGLVISSTSAVIVRGNAWIVVIAFILVLVIQILKKKDWKLLVVVVLLPVLPILCLNLITARYESSTKLDLSEGMPSTAWIAMGMGESPWAPGWYNEFSVSSYWEAEFNKAETAKLADARIRERFQEFASNPGYTVSFYKDKVISQWEAPMYQSMFFNTQLAEESDAGASDMGMSDVGTWMSYLCSDEGYEGIRNFCDRWQFLVYLGMLCYFFFAVQKNDKILSHAFGVALIGYFLFSILWEGKARYIFPCYVMMFPLAAVGILRVYLASVPYVARLSLRSRASEKKRLEGSAVKGE